jgi:hypothetical protein
MTNSPGSPPTLVATPELAKFTVDVMTRLADEGIPLKAIARITKFPCDHVVEVLREALEAGTIIFMPKTDWPIGSTRDDRAPLHLAPALDPDTVTINVIQCFRLTKLEAALFLLLVKRREVTRDILHKATMQRRSPSADDTDPKIVDVMICKLRKKLIQFDLRIDTIWSCGYTMSPEHRIKAAKILEDWLQSKQIAAAAAEYEKGATVQ